MSGRSVLFADVCLGRLFWRGSQQVSRFQFVRKGRERVFFLAGSAVNFPDGKRRLLSCARVAMFLICMLRSGVRVLFDFRATGTCYVARVFRTFRDNEESLRAIYRAPGNEDGVNRPRYPKVPIMGRSLPWASGLIESSIFGEFRRIFPVETAHRTAHK